MTWPGTVPLATTARSTILDLDQSVGIRSATYRFRHYNGVTGVELGDLTPYITNATLTHDTNRSIKRSVSLTLGVADTDAINPITDRVAIYMVVGDTEYPLGRYMFTDNLTAQSTGGNRAAVSLVDEMFLIDQPLSSGFALSGSTVTGVLKLLSGLPIAIEVETSPYVVTVTSMTGAARGGILGSMATQGDYQTPWMDNNGVFRMIRTIDSASAVATIDMDTEKRVLADTISRTVDILAAPNRFIVVGNGASTQTSGEIKGVFDIPASAPHSIYNRGFVIPSVFSLPVQNSSQARSAARNIGLTSSVAERCTLSTPPDPRHDSYDVIVFDGTQWLETAWSMQLREGGRMTHTLVRAYL